MAMAALNEEPTVPVTCNNNRGMFLLSSHTIYCHCADCKGKKNMTPTEFERHSGMATSKKWRRSIKVEDGPNCVMSIGCWLDSSADPKLNGAGGPKLLDKGAVGAVGAGEGGMRASANLDQLRRDIAKLPCAPQAAVFNPGDRKVPRSPPYHSQAPQSHALQRHQTLPGAGKMSLGMSHGAAGGGARTTSTFGLDSMSAPGCSLFHQRSSHMRPRTANGRGEALADGSRAEATAPVSAFVPKQRTASIAADSAATPGRKVYSLNASAGKATARGGRVPSTSPQSSPEQFAPNRCAPGGKASEKQHQQQHHNHTAPSTAAQPASQHRPQAPLPPRAPRPPHPNGSHKQSELAAAPAGPSTTQAAAAAARELPAAPQLDSHGAAAMPHDRGTVGGSAVPPSADESAANGTHHLPSNPAANGVAAAPFVGPFAELLRGEEPQAWCYQSPGTAAEGAPMSDCRNSNGNGSQATHQQPDMLQYQHYQGQPPRGQQSQAGEEFRDAAAAFSSQHTGRGEQGTNNGSAAVAAAAAAAYPGAGPQHASRVSDATVTSSASPNPKPSFSPPANDYLQHPACAPGTSAAAAPAPGGPANRSSQEAELDPTHELANLLLIIKGVQQQPPVDPLDCEYRYVEESEVQEPGENLLFFPILLMLKQIVHYL